MQDILRDIKHDINNDPCKEKPPRHMYLALRPHIVNIYVLQ